MTSRVYSSWKGYWAPTRTALDPNIPWLPLESAPGSQNSWPNPSLRRQGGFTDVAVNLLLTVLTAAAVAAPFAQEDWPNPQRRAWSPQTEVAQNLLGTLLAPAQAPFVLQTWANPRGTNIQPPYQLPSNVALLAEPVSVQGFNKLDWPNPTLRVPDQRGFIYTFADLDSIPPAPVVVTTSIPSGVKNGRKRELIVSLKNVQNREDTAEFLKSQLRLRHPQSAFVDTRVADQQAEQKRLQAQADREREMREKAQLLAAMELAEAKRQKLINDNNAAAIILTMIAAQMEDE